MMVVIGGEERIVCQEATRKEREIRLYKIVGGFFVCVCVFKDAKAGGHGAARRAANAAAVFALFFLALS